MDREITGVMVYYNEVCQRKLWYFYHGIQLEQDNENVKIGKVLDEETYKRDEKHINIDNVINIDFIRSSGVGSVATAKSCKDTSADRTGSAEVCS